MYRNKTRERPFNNPPGWLGEFRLDDCWKLELIRFEGLWEEVQSTLSWTEKWRRSDSSRRNIKNIWRDVCEMMSLPLCFMTNCPQYVMRILAYSVLMCILLVFNGTIHPQNEDFVITCSPLRCSCMIYFLLSSKKRTFIEKITSGHSSIWWK